MIRAEDEGLDPVVPIGNSAQHCLQLRILRDVAAAEEGESAEAQGATQHIATVDLGDELAVVVEKTLVDPLWRAKHRSRRRLQGHGVLLSMRRFEVRGCA